MPVVVASVVVDAVVAPVGLVRKSKILAISTILEGTVILVKRIFRLVKRITVSDGSGCLPQRSVPSSHRP